MLWILFLILLAFWFVGVVTNYTIGGWIHLLLVLAVIALAFQVIARKDSVR